MARRTLIFLNLKSCKNDLLYFHKTPVSVYVLNRKGRSTVVSHAIAASGKRDINLTDR